MLDLTTSVGYYGSLSFPLRPPSPFSDGVIWSEMSQQPRQEDDSLNEVFIWSPDTKQLTVHYNVNNNNSTHIEPIPPVVSRASHNWKRVWNRLVHRPTITTISKIGSFLFMKTLNIERFLIRGHEKSTGCSL